MAPMSNTSNPPSFRGLVGTLATLSAPTLLNRRPIGSIFPSLVRKVPFLLEAHIIVPDSQLGEGREDELRESMPPRINQT